MKKYLLLLLIVQSAQCLAFVDTISLRRMKLDSMAYAIKYQMENLDSSVKLMDRFMDSITGKQVPKLDTMAVYRVMQEKIKQEQRQKEMLWFKLGGLGVIVIGAVAIWRRRRWKASTKQ